ncbi:Uma2 family endonuclease [Microcoleus sp. C2C3]|uniref:Uma2 family endonuclease n=1 Tax=unclassified Microcoleus TaxID=2642155 RepID=UPI002FD5EF6D
MVTTTSTPVEQQTTPENRVILKGVTWSTFKALLADVGDDRAWRIAYDEGVLEIRMPLEEHEEPKRLIESFVEAIVDELEIELRSLGSLTLEREDLTRAVEPDSCFYIQNESLVRGRNINLPNDPPPDLAIESDYTNSSVNKFTIYAAIGVPEIWRYRRESLQVYQLVDGKYEKCDRSLAFPFLPVAEIPGFIEQSRTVGQRAAVRLFRQRIKEILLSQSSRKNPTYCSLKTSKSI